MFGATTFIIKTLVEDFKYQIKSFNLQTENIRIKNYISKPTGKFLEWYTTYQNIYKDGLYFAIDNTGTYLGIYDLTQKLELRPTSVGILLVNYLKTIEKKEKALIYLTPALGLNILYYIKKLGYKYKLIETLSEPVQEDLKEKKVDLFIDELGGYYFLNDPTPCFNPLMTISKIDE
jgi:phosphomannomutase